MRTFIAIEIPENIRIKIFRFSEQCRNIQSKNIKYVERDNLHITLKFLGETGVDIIDKLSLDLKKIKIEKFDLNMKNTGAFPNIIFPKVIWAGIGNSDTLNRLFTEIENTAVKQNFKKEDRNFNPHLTLARVKGNASKELIEFIKSNGDIEFGNFTVHEFCLFESKLMREGPVYSKYSTFQLIGA